jgi:hypothetical protein
VVVYRDSGAAVVNWDNLGEPELKLEKLAIGYRCHIFVPALMPKGGSGERVAISGYYETTWGLTAYRAIRRANRSVRRHREGKETGF